MAGGTGESVAVELRRAREDSGRDLARVAQDLKIRRVYLQAIEDGRFDDLPGATYAVGFVRAYAEHLGLDSVETVARFKDEVEGINERLHLAFPTPAPESKIPSGAVLLMSLALIVLAYGGWYYLSGREEGLASLGDQVLELPDNLAPLVSDSEETAAEALAAQTPIESGADPEIDPADDSMATTRSILKEPAEAANEPAVSQDQPLEPEQPQQPLAVETPEETQEETEPEQVAEQPAQTVTETVAAAPVEAAGIPTAPAPEALLPGDGRPPRIYGVENDTARIVLRARLDSWVQVHAADQSLLMTRVLQPGDTYRVPDRDGLTLVTGNAGGLQIEVDGALAPTLGPVGAVRRGVALDPQRLLDGTALP